MTNKVSVRERFLEGLVNQTVLILLVVFSVVMAAMNPRFLSWWNVQSILLEVSIYGVVACGMALLIICGEFDLSAPSQFMWAQILFVMIINVTNQPWLALGLTLLSGLAFGTLNGVIVTVLKVNAFVATLGTMVVFRGLALVVTGGGMVSTRNEFVRAFGGAEFLGLSVLFWIFALVVATVSGLLSLTNFGRRVYATGGDPEVARLAGINTGFQKAACFSIMGVLCAIAGIMLVGQLRAGSTQYGVDLALTAVAATVIGGTRLGGGAGSAFRAAIGMLVLVVLYKALVFLGLQAYYQTLTQGSVLVLVVLFDGYVARRRFRQAQEAATE